MGGLYRWEAGPLKLLRNWSRRKANWSPRTTLTERVWRGIFVEESALRVHIAAIRKAFGPDRDMLSTTVGRGYRLLGSWRIRHVDPPVQPAAPHRHRQPISPRRRLISSVEPTAIAHLWDLLSAYRIISLIGPGGIGKTALALQCARSPPVGFEADRLLVELASLSIPDLIPSAVAGVLGIKLEGEDISAEFHRARDRSATPPAYPRQLRAPRRCRGKAGRDDRQPLPRHDNHRDQPRSAAHRWRTCLSRSCAGRAARTPACAGRSLEHTAVELFMTRATGAGLQFRE